jgi:hypothetical protein
MTTKRARTGDIDNDLWRGTDRCSSTKVSNDIRGPDATGSN